MTRFHRYTSAIGAALLLSSLAAGPAQAQASAAQMEKIAARFNAADQDHDGKLTLAEAQAGMPMVARYFKQIDASHSGAITLAQIAAYMKQQRGG